MSQRDKCKEMGDRGEKWWWYESYSQKNFTSCPYTRESVAKKFWATYETCHFNIWIVLVAQNYFGSENCLLLPQGHSVESCRMWKPSLHSGTLTVVLSWMELGQSGPIKFLCLENWHWDLETGSSLHVVKTIMWMKTGLWKSHILLCE